MISSMVVLFNIHVLHTVKPEKNTTIKFHKNALKQFSRRLKFTNLASEPQKYVLYVYNMYNSLTDTCDSTEGMGDFHWGGIFMAKLPCYS